MTEGDLGELLRASAAAIIIGETGSTTFAAETDRRNQHPVEAPAPVLAGAFDYEASPEWIDAAEEAAEEQEPAVFFVEDIVDEHPASSETAIGQRPADSGLRLVEAGDRRGAGADSGGG